MSLTVASVRYSGRDPQDAPTTIRPAIPITENLSRIYFWFSSMQSRLDVPLAKSNSSAKVAGCKLLFFEEHRGQPVG